jgi:threonine synthase
MKYISTKNKQHQVSFREAVLTGLAPEGGLYMPETITPLPQEFYDNMESMSKEEIGMAVMKQFVSDEIDEASLLDILKDTLAFDFPVVHLHDNIYTLELFHGPTLAFKDVGAKFMARCLSHFLKADEHITILAATSGDTGSAVGQGFKGVEGVDVVLLYPKGKISKIQESQLTTIGQNIVALEVSGDFDNCQTMVKEAFADEGLKKARPLSSANSINIARLLPQSLYYFFAYQQLAKQGKKLVVSIPSGNYGNLTAGLFAQRLGLPISQFIASSNSNSTVPDYLTSAEYRPRPSLPTISNAMDVGSPSNFYRMAFLFGEDYAAMCAMITGYSYSDETTQQTMKQVHTDHGYLLDPHGAVGYLGLSAYLKDHPDHVGVFLETAHPAKFKEVVDEAVGLDIDIPTVLADALSKEKQAIEIEANYEYLKEYLMS